MEKGPQEYNESLCIGIKEKLANLKNYMPNQDKIIYDFAKFISKRVNDNLLQEDFNTIAELAVSDLQDGIDSKGIMSNYTSVMYTFLNIYIPQIKEKIFDK